MFAASGLVAADSHRLEVVQRCPEAVVRVGPTSWLSCDDR